MLALETLSELNTIPHVAWFIHSNNLELIGDGNAHRCFRSINDETLNTRVPLFQVHQLVQQNFTLKQLRKITDVVTK